MPSPKIWISRRKNNIMLLLSTSIIEDSQYCAALFPSPQPVSQISHLLLRWRTDRMLLAFSAQLPCQLRSLTILCVCMFVFWAHRGCPLHSSQVLPHFPLRQTVGLWKPLMSTLQSIGTFIICLDTGATFKPASSRAVWLCRYWCWLFSTCTGSWEGRTAQVQHEFLSSLSAPKTRVSEFKASSAPAPFELHHRCVWKLVWPPAARMVSEVATLEKCPGYKQKGKRQLIPVNIENFLSAFSLVSGPHPPRDSLSVPTPFLKSACLSFPLLHQSSEGSLHYFMIQMPTPMVLVKNWWEWVTLHKTYSSIC